MIITSEVMALLICGIFFLQKDTNELIYKRQSHRLRKLKVTKAEGAAGKG